MPKKRPHHAKILRALTDAGYTDNQIKSRLEIGIKTLKAMNKCPRRYLTLYQLEVIIYMLRDKYSFKEVYYMAFGVDPLTKQWYESIEDVVKHRY